MNKNLFGGERSFGKVIPLMPGVQQAHAADSP